MFQYPNLQFQIAYVFYNPTDSEAVQLTQKNIDMTLGKLLSPPRKKETYNLNLQHPMN